MKPLAIDLACGLGGWSHGLLAEGWDCVGFDIERHSYGGEQYPAQLVLQDILTIDGRQFRGKASLIVASPPCQEYSYMAMPWSRAKAIAAEYRSGVRDVKHLTALFDACVRIGREAECPIVIENVRGAQPWVGRARANYGSFYLWGDVPALMPTPYKARKFNPDGTNHGTGSWFAIADSKNRGASEGAKVPGFRFDGSGRSSRPRAWKRTVGYVNRRDGYSHTRHLTNQAEHDGVKQGGDWFSTPGSISRSHGSKSSARKAASARIAKIPATLARYIARFYHPNQEAA